MMKLYSTVKNNDYDSHRKMNRTLEIDHYAKQHEPDRKKQILLFLIYEYRPE